MKNAQGGFSLIELILAVAIVLIIGGFSMSFSTNFLLQNAAANTRDQFIGELRKAQTYALSSKENSNWGVQYTGNTITLFKGTSYAARDTAWDEIYESNANLSISGPNEIVFTKMSGLPSTTGTITITGVSTSKTVTINSQGVVGQ